MSTPDSSLVVGAVTFGPAGLVPDPNSASGFRLAAPSALPDAAVPPVLRRRTPEEMTVAELQAEIAMLQMVLHRKVLGDPRVGVSAREG